MDLNRILYRILMAGSMVSISLFILGLSLNILYPIESTGHRDLLDLSMFSSDPSSTLLLVGVMILIVTPMIAAVASSIIFALRSEYKFAIVTFLVFLVIVVSLLLGVTGKLHPLK